MKCLTYIDQIRASFYRISCWTNPCIYKKKKKKKSKRTYLMLSIGRQNPFIRTQSTVRIRIRIVCLLVKRRNDNHSPGPVIRELVPSSHQKSEKVCKDALLLVFSVSTLPLLSTSSHYGKEVVQNIIIKMCFYDLHISSMLNRVFSCATTKKLTESP